MDVDFEDDPLPDSFSSVFDTFVEKRSSLNTRCLEVQKSLGLYQEYNGSYKSIYSRSEFTLSKTDPNDFVISHQQSEDHSRSPFIRCSSTTEEEDDIIVLDSPASSSVSIEIIDATDGPGEKRTIDLKTLMESFAKWLEKQKFDNKVYQPPSFTLCSESLKKDFISEIGTHFTNTRNIRKLLYNYFDAVPISRKYPLLPLDDFPYRERVAVTRYDMQKNEKLLRKHYVSFLRSQSKFYKDIKTHEPKNSREEDVCILSQEANKPAESSSETSVKTIASDEIPIYESHCSAPTKLTFKIQRPLVDGDKVKKSVVNESSATDPKDKKPAASQSLEDSKSSSASSSKHVKSSFRASTSIPKSLKQLPKSSQKGLAEMLHSIHKKSLKPFSVQKKVIRDKHSKDSSKEQSKSSSSSESQKEGYIKNPLKDFSIPKIAKEAVSKAPTVKDSKERQILEKPIESRAMPKAPLIKLGRSLSVVPNYKKLKSILSANPPAKTVSKTTDTPKALPDFLCSTSSPTRKPLPDRFQYRNSTSTEQLSKPESSSESLNDCAKKPVSTSSSLPGSSKSTGVPSTSATEPETTKSSAIVPSTSQADDIDVLGSIGRLMSTSAVPPAPQSSIARKELSTTVPDRKETVYNQPSILLKGSRPALLKTPKNIVKTPLPANIDVGSTTTVAHSSATLSKNETVSKDDCVTTNLDEPVIPKPTSSDLGKLENPTVSVTENSMESSSEQPSTNDDQQHVRRPSVLPNLCDETVLTSDSGFFSGTPSGACPISNASSVCGSPMSDAMLPLICLSDTMFDDDLPSPDFDDPMRSVEAPYFEPGGSCTTSPETSVQTPVEEDEIMQMYEDIPVSGREQDSPHVTSTSSPAEEEIAWKRLHLVDSDLEKGRLYKFYDLPDVQIRRHAVDVDPPPIFPLEQAGANPPKRLKLDIQNEDEYLDLSPPFLDEPLRRKVPQPTVKDFNKLCEETLGLLDKECNIRKGYPSVPNAPELEKQRSYNKNHIITSDEQAYYDKPKVVPTFEITDKLAQSFEYPFGRFEGLYWPVFQPTDGIVTEDLKKYKGSPISPEEEARLLAKYKIKFTQRDVANQLCDLSCQSYLQRKEMVVLGSTDPDNWQSDFDEAWAVSDEEGFKSFAKRTGRFNNRVMYRRKIETQTREEAIEADRRLQEEEEEWIRSNISEDILPESEPHERINADRRCNASNISGHVKFNLIDSYSCKELYPYDGNRSSIYPEDWETLPIERYIPSNDRRSYLCQLVNFYMEKSTIGLDWVLDGNNTPEGVLQWQKSIFQSAYVHQRDKFGQHMNMLSEEDIASSKTRSDSICQLIKRMEPSNSDTIIEKIFELCQLEEWEFKNWCFIYDSLVRQYRMFPPVSNLMPELKDEVDEAFRELVPPAGREICYKAFMVAKKEENQSQQGETE